MGARYEWVRAMVEVKHRSLSAFEQYLLAALNHVSYVVVRVRYVRAKLFCIAEVILQNFIIVYRVYAVNLSKHFIFNGYIVSQFFFENFFVHQIANADTYTVNLICVARTDTVFRGADFSVSLRQFFGFVQTIMIRQNYVCAVRNLKRFSAFAFLFQISDFA